MQAMVVIPSRSGSTRRVAPAKVHSIICNRLKGSAEQFLVRWKTDTDSLARNPPLSWHSLDELELCLEYVQDYLEKDYKSMKALSSQKKTKKRKSPDTMTEFERRLSPINRFLESRTPSASRSSSVASTPPLPTTQVVDVYNGQIDIDERDLIYCYSASGANITQIDIDTVPTPDMAQTALCSKVGTAEIIIRSRYLRRLEKLPGKKVHFVNTIDASTPSLRFQFIPGYVLRDGVYKAPPETQEGCKRCSPHMGRSIGCEYTKKCDCLEYAAVDEARITDPDMRQEYLQAKAIGGSTIGFPKKFPYYCEGAQRTGCLVRFYLESRRAIYECNDNCKCGPNCRNKNVQFGCKVELEIFKTAGRRGWGLRCRQQLYEGQFIDTYRGEIITDAEATRREESSSKAKMSYLYSLDKFAESEGLEQEEIYVVDGEFMGGPTKFMNHSCQPNCRQYTVSYNKHDCRVYDLAFFASRDIPAGEELTFDYLDKDDEDDSDEEDMQENEKSKEEKLREGAVPCLCGAKKCREWLWT